MPYFGELDIVGDDELAIVDGAGPGMFLVKIDCAGATMAISENRPILDD